MNFIKQLAIVEGFPYEVSVTQQDLEDNLFTTNSNAEALIFYVNEQTSGFAVYYYYSFSTTTGKCGLHLDDLFIEPEYQGQSIGKKVLVYLAKLAKEKKCARFEWWALNTNEAAIRFYLKLGAKKLEELSVFRLDVDGINNLSTEVNYE